MLTTSGHSSETIRSALSLTLWASSVMSIETGSTTTISQPPSYWTSSITNTWLGLMIETRLIRIVQTSTATGPAWTAPYERLMVGSRFLLTILSSLLYGSETWTPYRRCIKKLDNFHISQDTKRAVVGQNPQHRILNRCKITGVEVMIMQSQLRWCGHVHRMPDSRIPKQLLYGQLADSARSQGGQRKRYKDHLRR